MTWVMVTQGVDRKEFIKLNPYVLCSFMYVKYATITAFAVRLKQKNFNYTRVTAKTSKKKKTTQNTPAIIKYEHVHRV